MPINTANQTSVSQAPFSFKQSAHLITPANNCIDMPNMAEITGVIPNGWKIQQNTVMLMVITTANSSCDNGPSFFNFSFAIAGASGVS